MYKITFNIRIKQIICWRIWLHLSTVFIVTRVLISQEYGLSVSFSFFSELRSCLFQCVGTKSPPRQLQSGTNTHLQPSHWPDAICLCRHYHTQMEFPHHFNSQADQDCSHDFCYWLISACLCVASATCFINERENNAIQYSTTVNKSSRPIFK